MTSLRQLTASPIRTLGMSLVELLVALTIGLFLVGGALTVYSQNRANYQINDGLARMQENARFALSVMEPDLRLAGFWGRLNTAGVISGRRGGPGELPPIGTDCAPRWYIDISNSIEGANNANPFGDTCIPNAEYQPNTDVLVTRHAAGDAAAALNAGQIYLRADEVRGALFDGGGAQPAGFAPGTPDFELLSSAYYVRPYSFAVGDGIPSLRRQTLSVQGGGPAIVDEEVISGIEDLQFQFGFDRDGDGSADRYVNADNPALTVLDPADPGFDPAAQIVAVRVWLRLRAENIEVGFNDQATYTYADQIFSPQVDAPEETNIRRILVSKTIHLRNTLGSELSL